MKKYSQEKDYKVIAFCISKFYRGEQRRYIDYICKYAREYHCKVFVFSTLTDLYYDDMNDRGEMQMYAMLQAGAFDAVVIMSDTFKNTYLDREIAERATQAGIPVISVNKQLEGCTNIDFTYADTFEAIVRHIVEFHGCRRVNYIGGDTLSKFSRERFEVYRKVLEENGIPFDRKRTGYGYFRKSHAIEVLDSFLNEKDLPEAIICANDVMAVAVCTKLRSLGLRVPEDVKVTGFDGAEVEKYHNPRLTTAAFDWEKTARTILEVAVDLAEGKKVQPLIWIPYVHQLGHSCGCNHNFVLSATERLFDEKVYQSEFDEYYQRIMNTSSKANRCEDFSELISLMEEISIPIRYKELWICFLEDSYQKIVDKLPSEIDFDNNQISGGIRDIGSPQVVVVSHMTYQDKGETKKYKIEGTDMLPELEKVLEREDHMMFIPINLQGEFIGYIGVTFDRNKTEFGLLNLFVMNFKNMIESYWNRMSQEQLMIKDELTNLYNSKGFQKKTKKMFAGGVSVPQVTLLMLDMDNLKPISDTYGHEERDSVLRELSKILEQTIAEDELCARMGEDQFVIVSTGSTGKTRAQEIQDIMERRLADYNLISGKPYELEVSIGYASEKNVDALDFKALYGQADREAYNNKKKRKIF